MAKSKAPARTPRAEQEGGPLLREQPQAARPEHPIDFSGLLGQKRAIETLEGAIESGRIHHAWIFHGPPGVGKLTAARAFAAKLLLPRGGSASSAEERRRIEHLLRVGAHPDVHLVTKELAAVSRDTDTRKRKQTNIPKEVLREFFIEPFGLARTVSAPSAAGRVFIIEEAELIDAGGQNTILKALEEPPPGTVLILVTSDLDRLLPTVRSRCQKVTFLPLDEPTMQKWVQSLGLNLAGEELRWLFVYAAGAPGSLLNAAQLGLFAWHRQLEPMLAAIEKPGGRWPALGATMAALVDERAAEAVKASRDASKDAANRLWAKRLLTFLGERTRRALAADVAAGRAPDRHLSWIELLAAAERQLAANVAFAAVFENLATQMATEHAVMV